MKRIIHHDQVCKVASTFKKQQWEDPRWWLGQGIRNLKLCDSRNHLEMSELHLEERASIRIKLCNVLDP
jgi:hypothetical protein